jgi:hypothetical protein
MKPLWWMIGASTVSWLAVTAATRASIHPEVLLGMAAPLAAVGLTWIVTERTHAAAPERVTGVMVIALAVKMVFFGAYVAVMLRVLELRPLPFVASFTGYFIALYLMEALFLRRLFAEGPRAPSRG